MGCFSLLLTLFAIISPTFSLIIPRERDRSIHEKRDGIPTGWIPVQLLRPDSVVRVRFALKQSNIDKLDDYLMDIAHPESENYGQLWTQKQIMETFAASPETITTVKDWLMLHGLDKEKIKLSSDNLWLDVEMTARDAEMLLDTTYQVFEHAESGTVQMACDSYSLPSHIQKHVDFVYPGTTLNARKASNNKRSLSGRSTDNISKRDAQITLPPGFSANSTDRCDELIFPVCIRELYDFHYDFKESKDNRIGVSIYLQDDLDAFFEIFSPDLVGQSPEFVSIDGGTLQPNASLAMNEPDESDDDLQYLMTLVAPQKVTLYQTGDLVQQNEAFNNFLDAFDGSYCSFEGGDDPGVDDMYPDPQPGGFQGPEDCGTVKPANVISISYQSIESTFSTFHLQRQCHEFGKLSLVGTTFLMSSGDSGVASPEGCIDEETGALSANGTEFVAPLVCPYITLVGATQINPGATVRDPEQAFEITGGGFSSVFPQPTYQRPAVGRYLDNFVPEHTKGHFNPKGRGFPDICANGLNYTAVVENGISVLSGTSAATPVIASMIAAINDARIAIGKGPVGFINPILYSERFKPAFHDITTGGNIGCDGNSSTGFFAAPGWDPVTGLGTPNFSKMLELWLQLP